MYLKLKTGQRFYKLFAVILFSCLFSNYFINYDPIESNQYLLNYTHPSILDTLNYSSIMFDQSHEMPYGTFLFKDLKDVTVLDSIGTISQFIFKKGDYKYRDLLLSLKSLNTDYLKMEYVGGVRSFTPIYIPGVKSQDNPYNIKNGIMRGDSYLQNHMLSISKDNNFRSFNSTILYHDENPYLPISYSVESVETSNFNTRASKAILWGFSAIEKMSDYLMLNYGTQNMYSNILKYTTIAETFETNLYNKNRYYSGRNYLELLYNRGSFFFSSGFSDFRYNSSLDLVLESSLSNSLAFKKSFNFKAWLSNDNDKVYFDLLLDKVYLENHGEGKDYLTLKPSIDLLLTLNSNHKIKFEYKREDGFVHNASYRSLLIYDEVGFSLFRNMNRFSSMIGFSSISNISSKNHLESRYYPTKYSYLYTELSYTSTYLDLSFQSKNILSVKKEEFYPWMQDYINYSLTFKYPPINKPYIVFMNVSGNYILYEKTGIFVNNLPMFRSTNASEQSQHFIDVQFGLEFRNFRLSYSNITNNGGDFSTNENYSDIGTAFTLPTYRFLSRNISIFHHLTISWTFLD